MSVGQEELHKLMHLEELEIYPDENRRGQDALAQAYARWNQDIQEQSDVCAGFQFQINVAPIWQSSA